MSDEQLAAYLDKMIDKGRRNFAERFNSYSYTPQKFNIDTDEENDYCVEEDFADDAKTLEVLKVSQEAMKFFENDINPSLPLWKDVVADNTRIASRPLPMTGFMSDTSASQESDEADSAVKKDNADIMPMF